MADQEGNERHEPQKGQSIQNYPIYSIVYPIPSAQPWAKANGKGTALKGQRPYPEREKAAPVHSLCNTRPNRPYAVPLPSAALR